MFTPKHYFSRNQIRILIAVLCCLTGSLLIAKEQPEKPGKDEQLSEPAEPPVVTSHSLQLHGETIDYTAKTGKLILKNRKGEPTAEIFYIAYTKDEVGPEDRPLTFSFNGGPGSSSVWLHMGVLGPKRVQLDENGFAVPPPHHLADNAYSLLDETDLVFIDPVSTGYSMPADLEKEKEFHGLEPDVESVGEFIRRYVSENARWASPKFIIGESYGTTRAAALALHLQKRHGMYLNGVMLVSAVLDFATIRYAEDNDSPYVYFLPSLAATARYHGKLAQAQQSKPLEKLLTEVEAFAAGEYRQALFLGDALDSEKAASIAGKLSTYTGISVDEIRSRRLRLSAYDFFDLLLEDEGKEVGRYDGRYVGIAPYPWEWQAGMSYDPSYAQIYGAYSSAFNDYVHRELGYKNDAPYEILANVRPWDYGKDFDARYVNVSQRLREAIIMNPFLNVHVCAGYYDMATPYYAAEATFDRLLLHEDLRDNISFSYYEAGHMMYTVEAELARLKQVLAGFVRQSIAEND